MWNEGQIKLKLAEVKDRDSLWQHFNEVFLSGYRMALEDVLEIKRPRAKPSSAVGLPNQ